MTKKLRIGYAKLGRSMTLETTQFGFQGDAEAPQLLDRLARRNPNVTWVLVGRSRGEIDIPNVENPWIGAPRRPKPGDDGFVPVDECEQNIIELIRSLDGCVVHMGQHGTSHISIPMAGIKWDDALKDTSKHFTTPLLWAQAYGRYLIDGLNQLGDRTNGKAPVVWLCTDPRNYMKARDVKWPTGLDKILAQYSYTRAQKHERFRDTRTPDELGFGHMAEQERDGELWMATHTYKYADLELMILPDNWKELGTAGFSDRSEIGIASTSFANGTGKEPRRSELIRDIMLNAFPQAEIFGKWDAKSLEDVPQGAVTLNQPQEFFDLLNRWRVSLSLPALGSSWTVAKPYQLFASRVVCFMYGRLDDQGWVLPTRYDTSGKYVGTAAGVKLYSIRDDWTESELELAGWLRVHDADEFRVRAHRAMTDIDTWTWLVSTQWNLLNRRRSQNLLEAEIESQLGLCND